MTVKALVFTLGGSAEPIVKAIDEFTPEFVCSIASQDSAALFGPIKEAAGHRPARGYRLFLTPDHQSLSAGYEVAASCLREILDRGYAGEEIMVDITGGTKAMSAGLAMAAAPYGCSFNYTGGERRDKDGLGVVCSGSEQLRPEANVLDLLAVEERRTITVLFNAAQFAGARAVAERAAAKARPDQAVCLNALARILRGYELWDRFDHHAAREAMSRGAHELGQYLVVSKQADQGLEGFLAGVRENLAFLAELEDGSDKGRRIGRLHVVDLIANAGRRVVEGAYDDAVARLYRALEMRAQVALAERGINTGDVKPEQIPDAVREEISTRHLCSDGRIRLPLHASYQLLAALSDPAGLMYLGEKRAQALLDARNNSILAHGQRPVTPETYKGLREIALALTEVGEDELPRMPVMSEIITKPAR